MAELGALRPCSDAVREFLNGLGRPMYVVQRRSDAGGPDSLWRARLGASYPGYRLVYENDEIAFFRWSARP